MKIVYRCPECNKIIEQIEIDKFDEENLGLNVLTAEEKEDIIEVEYNIVYIDLTCDECSDQYNWNQLIYNYRMH